MKPNLLIVSGWAHGIEAIRPLGDALADRFEVRLLTGNEVLKARTIPDADFIVTGSMGGLLAMELLPASCKKLVLISSTAKFCSCNGYPCGTHPKILGRMIERFKKEPEAVLNDFFKNVHHPGKESRRSFQLRCEEMAGWSDQTKQDASSTLNDLLAGLEYLLDSDVRTKVPSINIPVLLLHGSEDRIIPAAASEWLHEHLPNSQLRLFDGHGHALAAHAFGSVMEEIAAFLDAS